MVFLFALSGLIGLAQTFAILTYAVQLALRISRRSLVNPTQMIMRGLTISVGLMTGESVLMMITMGMRGATTRWILAAAGVLTCGCVEGFPCFEIWGIVVLVKCRKALSMVVKLARATLVAR